MNSSPKRLNRRKTQGFGLLEALVALVLLSSVGFALLAWVQQSLDTTHRIRELYIQQDARRYALEWIRNINPGETPEGEIKYGNLRISWKSNPDSPAIQQTGYPQGVGKHEITLYKTEVSIFRDSETTPWLSESFSTIGYRRTGSSSALPFQ